MAIKSGFHNSINGDRKYNAEDMNRPYKDILSNGVFPNPSDQLQVFASSGMTVSVSVGGGLFGNGWAYNDAPEFLTLDPAEATLNRIDAIVVKRDESESVRDTILYVKKGEPGMTGVAPEMTHDDYVDEYCLATIYVSPNTATITQAMITDTRPDTNVCGWVTGLIDQVDTSTLFAQWQSAYEEQFETFTTDFEEWLESVQGILANDESASAEIVRLGQEKADKKKSTLTLLEAVWVMNDDGFYYQTVNVDGVTANSIIIVGADKSNIDAYSDASVTCTDQGDGTLTFRSNMASTLIANIVNMGE